MTQIIPQQSFSLILFICECIYFNSRTSKQKIDIDPIEKFQKKPFLSLSQHPDDKLLNILLLKGQNEFCKFKDQSPTSNQLKLIGENLKKDPKVYLTKVPEMVNTRIRADGSDFCIIQKSKNLPLVAYVKSQSKSQDAV